MLRRYTLPILIAFMLIASIPSAQAGEEAVSGPQDRPPASWGYRSPYPIRAPRIADKLSGGRPARSVMPTGQEPGPSCPSVCTPVAFPALQTPDGGTPGDPTGAGGDNHVVTAVNVSLAVYSRTGTQEVATQRFDQVIPTVLPFFFDPKVIYDQYTDHYVLVFVGVDDFTRESEIYTVSIPDATATTMSTWCARTFDGDQSPGNGKQWADYPGVGYDQSRLYISANMFNWGPGGEGSQVLAIDKAGLYDCLVPETHEVFTTDELHDKDGKKIWTIQPATTVGSTPSREYFLASRYNCPGGNCAGDRMVVGSLSGSTFTSKVLSIPAVKMPYPTQKGTPLSQPEAFWDGGDLRFANAFYDADTNQLFAAHAISKDKNKDDGWVESAARWYEVAPAVPLKGSLLQRRGDVATSRKDAGWPVVGSDSAGNLWVNYSRASGAPGAKEYLGAWMAIVFPGETKPAEKVRFAKGTSLYAYLPGVQRWGDYNASNRDPVDGAYMWMVNERAVDTNDFQQVVTQAYNV